MYYAEYYRWLLVHRYFKVVSGLTTLLDVGCRDGLFLLDQSAQMRVGMDLHPVPLPEVPATLVQADALYPPFRPGSFETIFTFDVIEHVEDDAAFLRSVVELLAPGGTLWLTTPCADFRISPAFLTERASRGWGHLRNGYTAETLAAMLPADCQAAFSYWNAPFLRMFTLPLHFLSLVWPWLGMRGAALCAWLDHFFPKGERGHLLVRIHKLSSAEPRE